MINYRLQIKSFQAILLLFFPLFLLTACEEKEKEVRYRGYERFNIDVDTRLLDQEKLYFNNVVMQLPRHWNDQIELSEVPVEMLRFASISGNQAIEPHAVVYADTIKNAFIILSDLNEPEAYKERLLTEYEQMFNPDGELSNLNRSSYQLNNLLVHHFLLQTPRTVNIKILIERGAQRPFQLDMILPAYVYQDDLASVRSAIGTLKAGE